MSKLYDLCWDQYGDPDTFVEFLRGQMALHGISQVALGRRAGYSQHQINRWLTANKKKRVRPRFEARLHLHKALDQLIENKAA